MDAHLLFAWSWIVIGLATGVWLGAFFAREDWLGGYGSWPRRLVRLGHVSFVGTGLLNVAAHWTLQQLAVGDPAQAWIRAAFVAGAVTMPAVCFTAAFAQRAKGLFAVPVALLTGGSTALALFVAAAGV